MPDAHRRTFELMTKTAGQGLIGALALVALAVGTAEGGGKAGAREASEHASSCVGLTGYQA
jgi:hypothetical protein